MTDENPLRLDLDAIAVRLEQQPSRITNYSRISTKVFDDLIAELKRSYDLIDKYEFLYGSSFEEHFWIATCKPDAEGQCSLDIESYEELMELVAADKVEIPEYSHDNNELILHDGCTCGVSHEEWLESKN